MDAFKRATGRIIDRFMRHACTLPACVEALDAELAGFIPRMTDGQLADLREVLMKNNDLVMEEMTRRSSGIQD